MIRSICPSGPFHLLNGRQRRLLVGRLLTPDQVWNNHCGNDQNDRKHDEQFEKGKARLTITGQFQVLM